MRLNLLFLMFSFLSIIKTSSLENHFILEMTVHEKFSEGKTIYFHFLYTYLNFRLYKNKNSMNAYCN